MPAATIAMSSLHPFRLLIAFAILPTHLTLTPVCPLHSTAEDGFCLCDVAFPYCRGKSCNIHSRPTMLFPLSCPDCVCHHDLLSPTTQSHEVFERYAILHSLVRSGMHAERSLVYLCTRSCGGTGDRVRGIVSAFYLAMATERAFFLHSTVPQPLEAFFSSTYINWSWPTTWKHPHSSLTFMAGQPGDQVVNMTLRNAMAPSLAVRTNEYIVPSLFHWNRSFASILQEWDAYGAQDSRDRFEQSHRIWGIPINRIEPRFQHQAKASGLAQLASPMHAAYSRLLLPTPLLQSAVTMFASKHGWDAQTPFISVHLRTGLEFKSDPTRLHATAFDQAFDCVVKHTNGAGIRWHVASDTKHVVERFQERFQANGWDTTRIMSIFSLPDATSVHVDRFADGDRAAAARAEVFVHLDYWLVSHASKVFASTSTFSRTAAAVGGHEDVILVPLCVKQSILY